MKRRHWPFVTLVLAAGLLQGCASTKPCQGKLQPINAPVAAGVKTS